jgi:hypothetical protein
MKKDRFRTLLAAAVFLLAVLACAVPGLPGTESAPVADPNLINTIVAETFSAAVAQTAGIPVETPATEPAVTDPPVTIPAPGMTGTNIENLPDGTTRYTDYDGGFEVVFPAGWLAVRPNTDEFDDALANEGADNAMLRDQMTADQAGYDPNFDRLYSYPLRPDIEQNVIFGFSKLTWDPGDAVPLDNDAMGQVVRGLEAPGGIPGFRAVVAQLYTNVNGVLVIEIGGPFALDDGQGGTVPFYATLILFKPSPNSLARMTFTILQDHQAPISADVKSVIESIKLLGQ